MRIIIFSNKSQKKIPDRKASKLTSRINSRPKMNFFWPPESLYVLGRNPDTRTPARRSLPLQFLGRDLWAGLPHLSLKS